MPAYEFVTVDVFTDRRFGGNPLAVFPDARGLTSEEMQSIAAEFNLSETTFVLPPNDPKFHAQVRIFSTRAELPFAGHPNVGTGFVLARRDSSSPEHFTFEEKAGPVRVHVQRAGDGTVIGARIAAPRSLTIEDDVPIDVVAACAGLSADDIATGAHTPLVATVGMPFVIAEVADVATLSRSAPEFGAFRSAAARFEKIAAHFSLHLYAWDSSGDRRIRARMFSPLSGVVEDPATGSANAALAALLTSLAPGVNVNLTYEIEQGIEMGRPSRIIASARKTGEGPVSASIAGDCVPVMRGWLEL
ncbi:MAG: PhzF family phenazine biosynthesis protein [Acetobacteraceae bacterium]